MEMSCYDLTPSVLDGTLSSLFIEDVSKISLKETNTQANWSTLS
jgi:hypothetical protein